MSAIPEVARGRENEQQRGDGERRRDLARHRQSGRAEGKRRRHGQSRHEFAAFDSWRSAKFTTGDLAINAISGALADPDRDEINNLMEYALFLDPHTPDPGNLVRYSMEGGFFAASYTRREKSTAIDLAYLNQMTRSLSESWNNAPVVQVIDKGQTETVKFREQLPANQSDGAFYRLNVLHSP